MVAKIYGAFQQKTMGFKKKKNKKKGKEKEII